VNGLEEYEVWPPWKSTAIKLAPKGRQPGIPAEIRKEVGMVFPASSNLFLICRLKKTSCLAAYTEG